MVDEEAAVVVEEGEVVVAVVEVAAAEMNIFDGMVAGPGLAEEAAG